MDYVEYIDQDEYVILYRMYGKGAIAEIPQRIDGKPVRELADHLFAKEPSVLFAPQRIRRAVRRGESYGAGSAAEDSSESRVGITEEEPALCAEGIEIIRIPEGAEQIGNYAFYGCYRLREVSFPASMRRIGYGMFNGCRQVNRLQFSLGAEETDQTPAVMKEVLDAVANEIEAVVTRDGAELWRLTFPDYYEEGKENTPARIIEIVYHGTGRQYRNCFLNRRIQFDRYDEVFPLAQAQEHPGTCIALIRNRLRSGPSPEGIWAERYIEYLRTESSMLIRSILSDEEHDPVRELASLDRYGFFTSNIIDEYIESASKARRSDAVSWLMDRKRRMHSAGRSSRYEL